MKVSELIDKLLLLPPGAEVILQKDAEGNGYSPLHDVDGNAIYVPDTTWSGDVYSLDWSAADAGFSTHKAWEDFKTSYEKCCVLAPMN